jgi:hypothetical protein
MFFDEASPGEQATIEVAAQLRDTGNLHPLIARLRDGEIGPELARDVLRVLVELDPDLLVQITLDGLIGAYVEDPGIAHQPRRVTRGGEPNEAEGDSDTRD